MNQSETVVLKVDAFGGGIGGQQNTDFRVVRVRLKSRFDALAGITDTVILRWLAEKPN